MESPKIQSAEIELIEILPFLKVLYLKSFFIVVAQENKNAIAPICTIFTPEKFLKIVCLMLFIVETPWSWDLLREYEIFRRPSFTALVPALSPPFLWAHHYLHSTHETGLSHPHQHILSVTLPQPAVDTRNANEVTVEMSERPIFVVSKLDCSSPGGARRWRIYRRYAARLWFTRRSEGGPDYRHRTLTGMCGPRTL